MRNLFHKVSESGFMKRGDTGANRNHGVTVASQSGAGESKG